MPTEAGVGLHAVDAAPPMPHTGVPHLVCPPDARADARHVHGRLRAIVLPESGISSRILSHTTSPRLSQTRALLV